MLKVNVVAIGKIKEKYFKEGIAEYQKRLSRFANFTIYELEEENFKTIDDSKIALVKKIEGERILPYLKGFVIVTAIEGKKCSSPSLADKLSQLKNRGISEVTFVIGGSYGVDDLVKSKADLLLSVSDMTFPHTLFRLLLTEQIYRAFCILEGNPYHK